MNRGLAAAAVLGAHAVSFFAARGPGAAGLLVLLAYVVVIWTAYTAGLHSRGAIVVVASCAVAATGVRVALVPGDAPGLVGALVMFVALPLLVGRYLAQHRRLVGTLDAHNRQLRTEQALLAEREQLRERLRIARDVHDSLGRRLSIVSVRAAALEVAGLPPAQRDAVRALAGSARDAVDELYQLVGSLRSAAGPGADRIDALAEEFRSAGVEVTVTVAGGRLPLPPAVDHAVYRLVEEGLTNAAKHAPGAPVAVRLTWETGSLIVTVTNPVTAPGDGGGDGRGFGLAGLAERVGDAGGFVDHRISDGEFRLVAMLPAVTPGPPPARPPGRATATMLGVVAAVTLFGLLPVSMTAGVS